MRVWEEPVRGGYPPPDIIGLSGAERMALRPDVFPPPPIHHLFGLTPTLNPDDPTEFRVPATPWLQTAPGLFLGGTAALVADAPLGSAVLLAVKPGSYGVTSELSVSYLRPATVESGELRATGRLIDSGRSLGLSESFVTDASGRRLAHLTSRYFILRAPVDIPRPESLPPVQPVEYATPDPYMRPLDWTPPIEELRRYGGLEYAQRQMKGEIPCAPAMELFGHRLTSVEEGAVECAATATEWFNSPARTIYGGILAYLADSTIVGAVGTTVPAGGSVASLDLKVQYVRPGIADGRALTMRGEVVHRGRSLAVARAEIRNADGKPLVLATGSVMILDRPWQPVAVADEPTATDE